MLLPTQHHTLVDFDEAICHVCAQASGKHCLKARV